MAAEDARYTHPLMGVVICCTSISPEIRSNLSSKAIAMGAVHRHDLTSDVTHLIVGDLNTPKYKFVAQNRIDVKVVEAAWVEAMHEKWITGEDIDISEYEKNFKYPAFSGLKICVTNIVDNEERTSIQKLLPLHGGAYHPDLTRQVTHLIAALPEGRKYEFARQWQTKIVSPRWLYDSIKRGMALNESFYNPTLPEDKIGLGAMPAPPVTGRSIAPGGEDADNTSGSAAVVEDQSQHGGRRIRVNVTRKIEEHSQSIWDDIIGQAGNTRAQRKDEWDDTLENEDARSVKPRKRRIIDDDEDDSNEGQEEGEAVIADISASNGPQARQADVGMFNEKTFCIYFEDPKRVCNTSPYSEDQIKRLFQKPQLTDRITQCEVLQAAIKSHSGIVTTIANLSRSVSPRRLSETQRVFIIVPEVLPKLSYPAINLPPDSNVEFIIVSFWWIERCLHRKQFCEPQDPSHGGGEIDMFCFPFDSMPLKGFKNKEIITTGFSGINALHMSRFISLAGANFQDYLHMRRTKVVISAIDSAKTDKAQAALNWDIPVVTIKWLYACLRQGEWIGVDGFLVQGVTKKARDENDGRRKRTRVGETNQGSESESSDATSSTMRGDNTAYITRSGGPNGPNDERTLPILDDCIVCVSETVKKHTELKAIVRSLGAKVVEKFSITDLDLLTHLICCKQGSEEPTPEYNIAEAIPGCQIVSPDWLYRCRASKVKVDGGAYSLNAQSTEQGVKLKTNGSETLKLGHRDPFEVDDSDQDASNSEVSNGLNHFKPLVGPISKTGGSRNTSNTSNTSTAIADGNMEDKVGQLAVPNAVSKKPALTEFLKLGIDKLSTALDKPKKPRGRLRGKATSNMSAFPDIAASSNTDHKTSSEATESLLQQGDSLRNRAPPVASASDTSSYYTQLPPQSQALSYADPEAQMERKRMMAKLDGVEGSETPVRPSKEVRGAVVQDTHGMRRSTRNH